MTVRFLARHDWDDSGAPRLGHKVDPARFTRVNVHHTVSIIDDVPGIGDEVAYMRRLRTIRPDLGLDVPYSFVVFAQANPADSIVAEGRGWQRTGAHTAGENSSSYGVAFAGNAETETITPGVLDGIRFVGRGLVDSFNARPTLGHRDHKNTACPGANLYAHLPELQPPFAPTPTAEEANMLEQFIATAYVGKRGYNPFRTGRDEAGAYYWLRTAAEEDADSAWTWADCLASFQLGVMVSLLAAE